MRFYSNKLTPLRIYVFLPARGVGTRDRHPMISNSQLYPMRRRGQRMRKLKALVVFEM
jgi:hypothetical protein